MATNLSRDSSINDGIFNVSGLTNNIKPKFNASIAESESEPSETELTYTKRKGILINDESVHFAYEMENKKSKTREREAKENPLFNPLFTDRDVTNMLTEPEDFIRAKLTDIEHLSLFKQEPVIFRRALLAAVTIFNEHLQPVVLAARCKLRTDYCREKISEPPSDSPRRASETKTLSTDSKEVAKTRGNSLPFIKDLEVSDKSLFKPIKTCEEIEEIEGSLRQLDFDDDENPRLDEADAVNLSQVDGVEVGDETPLLDSTHVELEDEIERELVNAVKTEEKYLQLYS